MTLAGGTTKQYVELPSGLISALSSATFEAWGQWEGGADYQRIFDFGNFNGVNGETYLFLTPSDGAKEVRATLSIASFGGETSATRSTALASGSVHHVAVVIDDQNEMRLYVDGVLEDTVSISDPLSALNDTNNWIGRSQFSGDADFDGIIHEFRIYGAALSDAEVSASFALGSDPAFLEP